MALSSLQSCARAAERMARDSERAYRAVAAAPSATAEAISLSLAAAERISAAAIAAHCVPVLELAGVIGQIETAHACRVAASQAEFYERIAVDGLGAARSWRQAAVAALRAVFDRELSEALDVLAAVRALKAWGHAADDLAALARPRCAVATGLSLAIH